MEKSLFYGYYGHQNTGDDAFVEVSAWGAKKYWHSTKIKILAHNMPIIQNVASYTGTSYFKGHGLFQSVHGILTANSFICAGGSTFHSQMNYRNPKYIAYLKKRFFPEFKFGAIGVSLGPYRTLAAEKENIELLKSFDFLALRDRTSYQLAKTYNLPCKPIEAFDLAALLPEVYAKLPKANNFNNKKILGISVCNYETYVQNGDLRNEKRRNEQIERLLTNIVRRDDEIIFRFFIFNGHPNIGDEKLTLKMANSLKSIKHCNVEVINYDPCIYNTWIKMKECKIFLSTRLHGAIFACFADLPFFLIEYHRKCADFLNDVGYKNDDRIYDADFDVERFSIKLVDLIQGEQFFLKPTEINSAIEKARMNFTKINIHV